MSIALLEPTQRLLAVAMVVGCGAAAYFLGRRRTASTLVILLTVVASAAALTLALEQGVSLLVRSSNHTSDNYNEYRWVLLSPWGRAGLVLGCLVAAATIALSVITSRQILSSWRRAAIIVLRGAGVVSALVLFLEPAIELRQVAREPNHIAVVVDDSESMSLRDETDGPTRVERVANLLSKSASAITVWRENHLIDFYGLSDTLEPQTEAAVAQSAHGTASQIREGLEQLRQKYEGTDLAGVVLISDGLATGKFVDGATDGSAKDFLRSLDTRVHTVWAARPGLRDTAIVRVLADEFAFVRTVVRVEAVIRSTGYGKRRIPVTLSSEGLPMRRKWVDLEGGSTEARVAFEFTPSQVGRYVYRVETPVESDEAVSANNDRSFILRVIRDKFRVLQVAGRPSWDVRALRGMLKQNPNVDLISFFILRMNTDISMATNSEMSLIPFPTDELFQEQLPSFDLIILQNYNFLPYGMAQYLGNLKDYVRDGGALVMLGGSLSFTSGGYYRTPIDDLLPVSLLPGDVRTPDLIDTTDFVPRLTEIGRSHPITALRYDADDNQKAWAELPPLQGVNLVGDARADALVLAVHPTLKTPSGNPMPVMVAGEYGKGRTLAVTTDTLWHWSYHAAAKGAGDGHAYDRFWETSSRWLIKDPQLQLLRVESDRIQYVPGAMAKLEIHLLGPDYKPLGGGKVALEISHGANPQSVKTLERIDVTANNVGEASHSVGPLEAGVYRVNASATVAGKNIQAEELFLVRAGSAELDRSAGDPSLLEHIAAATDGQYLGPIEKLPDQLVFGEPRVVRVDRSTDVELWSGFWLLLLALAFLGGEWGLRQQTGYR